MRRFNLVPRQMVVVVMPLALTIMGDSLIYIVLPAEAADFGVADWLGLSASFWIGILLSVNRLVRIASNAYAAAVYVRFGLRAPFVGAVAAGALTTLAYGLASGILLLLAARMLWGICYSFMRLAAQVTAFEFGTPAIRGRMMGFFNAGQRSGSLVAVTAGAAIASAASREVTFSIIAAVGLLGVVVALWAPDVRLRRPGTGRVEPQGTLGGPWRALLAPLAAGEKGLRWPLFSISFVRFATAFAANGLVIATVSPYLIELMEDDSRVFGVPIAALTLAGLIVGTRWFSDLALSVPLGHLSDRVGRSATVFAGISVMVTALLTGAGVAAAETVVVVLPLLFIAGVLVDTTLDASMGETAPDSSRPAHMSRYSTYLDVGAALGPLLGFVVADRFGFRAGYLAAAVLLAVALAIYSVAASRRQARRPAE